MVGYHQVVTSSRSGNNQPVSTVLKASAILALPSFFTPLHIYPLTFISPQLLILLQPNYPSPPPPPARIGNTGERGHSLSIGLVPYAIPFFSSPLTSCHLVAFSIHLYPILFCSFLPQLFNP